jgi:putative acetyltransferase
MILRPSTAADEPDVRVVLQAAFGADEEANLVRTLHENGDVVASLVAVDDRIVGHILFSRLTIRTGSATHQAVALAPLSVVPDRQRRGIGTALVNEGLKRLREANESVVIVLGEPDYYGRFGFSADRARDLRSRYSGPAFMALELVRGALDGISGDVVYPAAFDPFG